MHATDLQGIGMSSELALAEFIGLFFPLWTGRYRKAWSY